MFSFTVAAMGAAALYFFFASGHISNKYRPAVLVSGVVVAIACYHYFRIHESWNEGFALTDTSASATYKETNTPFNDAYRYADWILTVPLLMVELVAVLALARAQSRPLLIKLAGAAALMIALGYPGEISSDPSTRWTFWGLSMIPFLYILYVLLAELKGSLERQPEQVRGMISAARWVIIITWSFYPIAYLATTLYPGAPSAEVALQVGYTIADVLAKAGFGVFIYWIASTKTAIERDEWVESPELTAV